MTVTASAVIDLRFGLRFAANRYRRYSEAEELAENAELFVALAHEREGDAEVLEHAANFSDSGQNLPMLDGANVSQLLGMGDGEPFSSTSAAYRVQRAENTIERMAAQLYSLAADGSLREALGRVRADVRSRREDVRNARRRAQAFGGGGRGEGLLRAAGGTSTDGQQVHVWFATNRGRDERGNFVAERAEEVTYGKCEVFVPHDRARGSLGRGLFGRILHGDNRVSIQSIDVLSECTFWAAITQETGSLEVPERDALVFLHGYNTKFADAARRTAQLKVDLAHKGPAAFFSWPSLGSRVGYSGDEAAIEGSELSIRAFLTDFAERSGARAVHIIAHSMGNRGLLRAMDAISKAAAASTSLRFGQVFLAAPDVDAQLFAGLAVAYGQLSTRATLYVTRNDKAIGLSKRFHRFDRVGLAPPISIVSGIDTVDASNVNLGLLGHGYVAEMRPVLADMYSLIQHNADPDRRFGLRRALGTKSLHWEFAP